MKYFRKATNSIWTVEARYESDLYAIESYTLCDGEMRRLALSFHRNRTERRVTDSETQPSRCINTYTLFVLLVRCEVKDFSLIFLI